MAALDPSYVFVNWVAVPLQPVHLWAAPTILQMANAPAPVLHFPNLFTVRRLSQIFTTQALITLIFSHVSTYFFSNSLKLQNAIYSSSSFCPTKILTCEQAVVQHIFGANKTVLLFKRCV
jgi:hypothetical protein